MASIEEKPTDPRSNTVVLRPELVAQRLDQALESFLQDHPHIPVARALAMWKEAGG